MLPVMGDIAVVPGPPLRVAVLVKQVPRFEALELGPDGRLRRRGVDAEMNPYCRRAVSQATDLVAGRGGSVVVFTLGPPEADEVLREAVAWATRHGVDARAVHLCDPAFAGSDTLATARALARAVGSEGGDGGFDLVLGGLNSVDADTGQVAPQLAELLGWPFLAAVRELSVEGRTVRARCELDDGRMDAEVDLPAVLTAAERLIEPAKVPAGERGDVPDGWIRVLDAGALGPGPWGAAGSPTAVGRVRTVEVDREGRMFPGAPLGEQVERAVELLAARGALDAALDHARDSGRVPTPCVTPADGAEVVVVAEAGRPDEARELLGAAATVAARIGGRVLGVVPPDADPERLWSWGADVVRTYAPGLVEDQVAGILAATGRPWAVLAPGTSWGRQVASRAAVLLDAGLTGDAVDLDVDGDRLVAWKPAFGGRLLAGVTASSDVQMVTVRPGVLPRPEPRGGAGRRTPAVGDAGAPRPTRVRVGARTRDDDLDALARAEAVIGVGRGVDPAAYGRLEPLRVRLGAELAGTRQVTDRGWLPRARQIGITGRSIGPRLYVAVGVAGKFNHMVGVRAARTVLAVNTDPAAPVFAYADVGIVGAWEEVVPALVARLGDARTGVPKGP